MSKYIDDSICEECAEPAKRVFKFRGAWICRDCLCPSSEPLTIDYILNLKGPYSNYARCLKKTRYEPTGQGRWKCTEPPK